MKRMGFFVMALVLALGIMGIGYAAWTDSITISGNVTTGDVDLVVEDYSCTYVWKTNTDNQVGPVDPDGDDIEIISDFSCNATPPDYAIDADPNGAAGINPVAYAIAEYDGDDKIKVTIDNAFPLPDGVLRADFLLHYAGSIPVKVTVCELKVTSGTIDPADVVIKMYESDDAGYEGTPIVDPVGAKMQLHDCDYILVVISVDLSEQDAGDMNKNGVLEGEIEVTQWNEV